jgi:putative PIN family toxin of toxin-antitoxin system
MQASSTPRVFLDTNVLFSGLRAPGGNPRRIIQWATEGAVQAVVSQVVLVELARNLRRKAPHLMRDLEQFLTATTLEVAPEAPDEEIARWRDAGLGTDAPIVAAAVLAEVDYFCTGDRRLLSKASLIERAGLRVVTPGELLEALG